MFQGNKRLRGQGETVKYTKKLIDEYIRCKEDIIYFAQNYVYITTIDKGKITIPLFDYQKKILKAYIEPPEGKRHLIVLQPRQSGKCLLSSTKVKLRNKKSGEIKELPIIEFFDMILEKHSKTIKY